MNLKTITSHLNESGIRQSLHSAISNSKNSNMNIGKKTIKKDIKTKNLTFKTT